jgi:hypothetical protein
VAYRALITRSRDAAELLVERQAAKITVKAAASLQRSDVFSRNALEIFVILISLTASVKMLKKMGDPAAA